MPKKRQQQDDDPKERKMYSKEKLEEALYFLLQMRQNYIDRKQFIYNMNAFLNSARSVTFTLQEEFANDSKFKVWYPHKRKEMKDDKLFSFFNDLRTVSVHKKGSPKHSLSVKAAYIFPKDGKMFNASTLGYTERKFSDSDKDEMKKLGLVFPSKPGGFKIVEPIYTLVTGWEFEKAPEGYQGKDILALCIEYYHKLKKIIKEAEILLLKENK